MDLESSLKEFACVYLHADVADIVWQPLTGDASFRKYFRIGFAGQSYIAALAPPETEKNIEFVCIADGLNKAGIKAPEVLAYDLKRGFLLQDDLGKQLLQPLLNDHTADGFYQKAMDQVVAMIEMDTADMHLGVYDREALSMELSYCPDWFIKQLLLYQLNDEEQAMIAKSFSLLLDSALEQPAAFVHRDYHSRNIMVLGQGELAAIDFQDALLGPITYDAVSVLRDCYIRFPDEQVDTWRDDFYQKLKANNIVDIDGKTFARWFDFMSLQRHIKVLGVFARLSIRDDKHGYLDDLPMVLSYIIDVSARHSELEAFHDWLKDEILPLCQKQGWGKSL